MTPDYIKVDQLLTRLIEKQSLQANAFAEHELDWNALGLVVRSDRLMLAPGTQLLEQDRVAARLDTAAAAWLQELKIWRAVDSTNKRLMELAESCSVDGMVHVAELQIQGRGRRGRAWFSPFACNLAVSAGIGIALEPSALGGLSLAIGLAGADCLARSGLDVELKWPNDLLVNGAKLGGILIEVVRRPAGVEAVIGIGMNVEVAESVRRQIDQPVVDLRQLGVTTHRSELVADLLGAVYRRVRAFEQTGFASMVGEFNQRHAFHGQRALLLQGEIELEGVVCGVSPGGELKMQTADGEKQFSAGEVSLRKL